MPCFGQEFELNASLSTSTEKRFKDACGVGFQFQHNVGLKHKIGLGLQYNYCNSKFDEISGSDADPSVYDLERVISSDANRMSLRFNIQRYLKNTNDVALSIGPDFSCNYLWGHCQRYYTMSSTFHFSKWSLDYDKVVSIGIGLIAQIEVKNIFTPNLSLCVNIRPELINGGTLSDPSGESEALAGLKGFTEFQLGFRYKLAK